MKSHLKIVDLDFCEEQTSLNKLTEVEGGAVVSTANVLGLAAAGLVLDIGLGINSGTGDIRAGVAAGTVNAFGPGSEITIGGGVSGV